jgi:regulator of sirC expression with transglutaminase-like and TPR domain
MPRNDDFREYLSQDEASMRPAVGALLFARDEYPGLDVDLYIGRLDALGRTAARRLDGVRDPYRAIRALNRLCFDEEDFRGDSETFADPRNGYLNEVLDRRRGIPITLAVIYLDAGSRHGLPLRGVAFPGHFLVVMDDPSGPVYIDPFNAGRILSHDDLRDLLARHGEPGEELRDDRHLLPAGPRVILTRMLRHLKGLYAAAADHARVLRVSDRLLDLDPDAADVSRDRGLAAINLHRYAEAMRDLLRYAHLAPRAPDAPRMLEQVRELRRLVPLMN